MKEFCLNNTNVLTDFFNCLHLMDTDDTIVNLDQRQIIIDQNLMYFNEESKQILSISPIAAKFLRNQYPVNIEAKERIESALIMYRKTEGSAKGTAFEEIIRFLVKKTNSFPFFIRDANEKKENVQVITPDNLYLNHIEFQSIFQVKDSTFISIENYHHDLIDAVYIGKQKIEGQKKYVPLVAYINFTVQKTITVKVKNFEFLQSYIQCQSDSELLEKYKKNDHEFAKSVCKNVKYIWDFHQKIRKEFKENFLVKYVLLTNSDGEISNPSVEVINAVEKWQILKDALERSKI